MPGRIPAKPPSDGDVDREAMLSLTIGGDARASEAREYGKCSSESREKIAFNLS